MVEPSDLPDPANKKCNWGMQACFGVMILYGGAFFLHPSVGPPALIEAKQFGWASPVLVMLWAGSFVASLCYAIWCYGLVPYRLHPGQTLSLCRRIGAYLSTVALTGWLSAILTWGVGLMLAGHLVFGGAFVAACVPVYILIGSMFRTVRRMLDKGAANGVGAG